MKRIVKVLLAAVPAGLLLAAPAFACLATPAPDEAFTKGTMVGKGEGGIRNTRRMGVGGRASPMDQSVDRGRMPRALAARSARSRRPGSRRMFAWWYGVLSRRAERGELGKQRRALLGEAAGRVLDLGAGPGESFRHIPSAVSEVIAVDPDPAMARQAARRLDDVAVPVRLVRAVGESLPFPSGTFDTAVVALVLCTVDDPETTAKELHRVLRPGGRLLLMEHVRAHDEDLACWQDRVQRPWAWLNGGCRPNRSTLETIQAAGFRLTAMHSSGFSVLPHVRGTAVRIDSGAPPS